MKKRDGDSVTRGGSGREREQMKHTSIGGNSDMLCMFRCNATMFLSHVIPCTVSLDGKCASKRREAAAQRDVDTARLVGTPSGEAWG